MKAFFRLLGLIMALTLLLISLMLELGQILPIRGMIAYTLVDNAEPRIMLLDPNTGHRLEISRSLLGDGLGRNPIWSRSGNQLAFWFYPERGSAYIYQITFPEYQIQNLSQTLGYSSLPSYGTEEILGFSNFPNGTGQFSLINPSNPDATVILDAAQAVQFSPDGRYLAYLAQFSPNNTENPTADEDASIEIDLYTLELATNEKHNWTANLDTIGYPQWSSDSRLIAFASRQRDIGTIFLANLETAQLSELPLITAAASPPLFSPDGRYLSFVTVLWDNLEIALLDLQNLKIRNISNSPFYDIQPAWSPDSQSIVFVSRRHGQDDLYRYDLPTDSLYRLTNTPENEADPAWQPR